MAAAGRWRYDAWIESPIRLAPVSGVFELFWNTEHSAKIAVSRLPFHRWVTPDALLVARCLNGWNRRKN